MSDNKRNVWFITGTSTGLGRAFAEYAIEQNYQVVVTARNIATVQDLVDRSPQNVLAVKLDVNSAEDIKTSIQAAVDRFGGIDVLINNAGFSLIGALEEVTDQLLRDQMDTNFFAAIAITREALPYLRAQKSGAVVQISSMAGSLAFPGMGAYSASKFALEGFSEALHAEVAPFGIKVIIAKPGFFRTAIASGKSPMASQLACRGSWRNTRSGMRWLAVRTFQRDTDRCGRHMLVAGVCTNMKSVVWGSVVGKVLRGCMHI